MHHFPWLRNRTTEHRKAGKARNTKENRRSKEFSTVSRQLVEHLSSASDNSTVIRERKNSVSSVCSILCNLLGASRNVYKLLTRCLQRELQKISPEEYLPGVFYI